jgi:uncharacterized membrane protein YkvA (DUF1232 family)
MTQHPMPDNPPPPPATDSRIHELVRISQHVWRLVVDPRVPLRYKAIPALALAYLLSPIDLVPDTIPFLTQIDDLAVLLIAARLFVQLADRRIAGTDAASPDAETPTVSTTYRVHEE